MTRPKVFCVGFHKTGTTTLDRALSLLGYRVCGCFGIDNPRIGEEALGRACELVGRFDAFQDNPWPILYRELDERFPGSRFILTTRPAESWLRSIVNHASIESSEMRRWIYGHGSPIGHEEVYLRRYEEHYRDVRAYFRDRPGDLLEMAITGGDGWSTLCPFLGVEEPGVPFPAENRASKSVLKQVVGHGRLRLVLRRIKQAWS